MRLVDHPAFSRLADIYQLGQTHLVFRGATHKRWEHALGTLHAAQLIVSALERNYREAESKGRETLSGSWRRATPPTPQETTFIRLAALLHDIGHLAAGHTFEDELGLLTKHDADERLIYVLDRKTWRGGGEETTLRELIDLEFESAALATRLNVKASEIFLELVSKTRTRIHARSDNISPRTSRANSAVSHSGLPRHRWKYDLRRSARLSSARLVPPGQRAALR